MSGFDDEQQPGPVTPWPPSETPEPQANSKTPEPQGNSKAPEPQGNSKAPEPQGYSKAPEPQANSEPRLLTRSVAEDDTPRARRRHGHPQHTTETGLRAWGRRLFSAPPDKQALSQRASKHLPQGAELRQRSARVPLHRWFAWVAGISVALVVVTALVMLLDLRHALNAALPQLDGETHLSGLHAPVSVTRDAQGVPSITAANLDDLLFAQGYVTAGDRLWQMDGIRRHAAGELAEILGPDLVEHDRRQRYLQIRAAADRAVAQLPPDQLAQLDAYARGVNAYIEGHRNALPMEFRLLAYRPAPWSPRDSLLVSLAIYQDMSTQFPEKINREALSAHLPVEVLADLYPIGSWRDQPPAAQDRNLTAPHEVEQIPLDPSQSRLQTPAQPSAGDLLAVSTGLASTTGCDDCRSGSNNWAVNGSRTASGKPMVSNDMHLNLGIPDTWYEVGLHADLLGTGSPGDRLDAVGFTLPGVPFIIAGRNAHVAWSLTNLGADVQDLRIEHLRGEGSGTEYERPDGTWAPVNHRPERIKVRGGRDLALDVLTSTHAMGTTAIETPILSPLYRSERRNLSLAWTAYDPSTVTSPFLGINTAADGSSLVAAFAGFGGPTLNLVWADDRNHIGYHALGRVPIRGLPVQHPRAAPEPVPPVEPGTAPPESDDEGTPEPADLTGPQAALATQPHLLLSAYRPLRHRVQPRPRRQAPPARSTHRQRRRATRQALAVPEPAAPKPAPLLPEPQSTNSTVGSPIAGLPVDALDASQEWSGYIGYGDLPAVTDPGNGFLVTANARVTPDDYPWAIADDWMDPFRAERLVHLLDKSSRLTPEDMLRLQMDVHSDVDQAMAQRLAYALDHASVTALGKDAKRLKQAADLLREWKGEMSTDSSAAAVLAAVREALWPALLVPQIQKHDGAGTNPRPTARQAAALASLYTWGERTTALELLLQNQPARWLPKPYARWSDFLATVVERGLTDANAPGNLRSWHYGQMHRVEIAHPVLGDHPFLSRLLGMRGSTGAQPAPGDPTTVDAIGAHFGPSERFTADLGEPGGAFANITTGQSANGHSPWYMDQFRPWLQGTTFPLPLAASQRTHTLRLLPQ